MKDEELDVILRHLTDTSERARDALCARTETEMLRIFRDVVVRIEKLKKFLINKEHEQQALFLSYLAHQEDKQAL